ncbi:MAG: hypothetical protein ACQETN_08505 [Bacillota bacterium]
MKNVEETPPHSVNDAFRGGKCCRRRCIDLLWSVDDRTMNMAHEAPTLASTLSHSAFNIGNAGGAALGGLAIEITHLQLVPLFAAGVTFIGLIITIMSYQSDKRVKRT